MNEKQSEAKLAIEAVADLITRWCVEAVVLALGAALRGHGVRAVTFWRKEIV